MHTRRASAVRGKQHALRDLSRQTPQYLHSLTLPSCEYPPKPAVPPALCAPAGGRWAWKQRGAQERGVHGSGTPPAVTTAPPGRRPGDSSRLLPRLNRAAPTREGRRGRRAAPRSQRLHSAEAPPLTRRFSGPGRAPRPPPGHPSPCRYGRDGRPRKSGRPRSSGGRGLESGNGPNGSSAPARARGAAPAARPGSAAQGSDPRDPSPGRSPPPPPPLREQRSAPPRH